MQFILCCVPLNFEDMNIYEMYYENDKQFGFWIKRNSWGNTIAKVIGIEGVIEGEEISGSKNRTTETLRLLLSFINNLKKKTVIQVI
jgi:hypothetical protein